MSTELGVHSHENMNMKNMNVNSANGYDHDKQSLDTPSRDSNATNNSVGIGGGISTNTNEKYQHENVLVSKPKQSKYSSLKADNNPLTMAREKKLKEGQPLMVNFDERVVVHTVPYWDPCGETFYDNDDEDGPRGPNCCIIL